MVFFLNITPQRFYFLLFMIKNVRQYFLRKYMQFMASIMVLESQVMDSHLVFQYLGINHDHIKDI